MYYKYSTLMGNLCKKEKSSDPNEIDDSHKEEDSEESYDLCCEVKKNVVVIYYDQNCKDCKRVLELFASINSKPLLFEISKDPNPKKLLKTLKKMTKDPKPPFVFITGKYFGGLTEIDAGIKNHTVQKLINDWLNSRILGTN